MLGFSRDIELIRCGTHRKRLIKEMGHRIKKVDKWKHQETGSVIGTGKWWSLTRGKMTLRCSAFHSGWLQVGLKRETPMVGAQICGPR